MRNRGSPMQRRLNGARTAKQICNAARRVVCVLFGALQRRIELAQQSAAHRIDRFTGLRKYIHRTGPDQRLDDAAIRLAAVDTQTKVVEIPERPVLFAARADCRDRRFTDTTNRAESINNLAVAYRK